MDADFSHDVNALPKMVAALQSEDYGLAMGRRYVAGGGIANWPTRRIITSKVACWLARPLTSVRDVTSGYFLVRRNALEGVDLDPIGFKIGLEVIAKAHYGQAIEDSVRLYRSRRRSLKTQRTRDLNYIHQLTRLYATVAVAAREGAQSLMPMPDWLSSRRAQEEKPAADAALWSKCPKCGEVLYRRDLAANLFVCTRCGHHFRMGAYDRIASIVDGDFAEIGGDVVAGDPLGWTDKKTYPAKLAATASEAASPKSVVCGFA